MPDLRDIQRTPPWLYRLRRFFRVRHVSIDGLRLIAYRQDIPKHVSQMLVRGDYELPERRAASQLLRKGDRVLEIGSCVGVVALTAAKIVGAENVLTFEPNPAAAAIARENFASNALPVELINAAVGVDDGTLDLRIAPDSWLGASGRRQFDRRTVATPMRSISRVVAVRPSVLVIDTEGMEAELLPACPLSAPTSAHLPEFLIKDELARGDLVRVLDLPTQSTEKYYLAWPASRASYAPLAAFRHWIVRETQAAITTTAAQRALACRTAAAKA